MKTAEAVGYVYLGFALGFVVLSCLFVALSKKPTALLKMERLQDRLFRSGFFVSIGIVILALVAFGGN